MILLNIFAFLFKLVFKILTFVIGKVLQIIAKSISIIFEIGSCIVKPLSILAILLTFVGFINSLYSDLGIKIYILHVIFILLFVAVFFLPQVVIAFCNYIYKFAEYILKFSSSIELFSSLIKSIPTMTEYCLTKIKRLLYSILREKLKQNILYLIL